MAESRMGCSKITNILKNLILLYFFGVLLKDSLDTSWILANVCKKGIPVDDVSLAVERSNHMKRKVRIIEGSNTRVERHEAGYSWKTHPKGKIRYL